MALPFLSMVSKNEEDSLLQGESEGQSYPLFAIARRIFASHSELVLLTR